MLSIKGIKSLYIACNIQINKKVTFEQNGAVSNNCIDTKPVRPSLDGARLYIMGVTECRLPSRGESQSTRSARTSSVRW